MSKKSKPIIKRHYDKHGTLSSVDDGQVSTFYEKDGKTISEIWRSEEKGEYILDFEGGKASYDFSQEHIGSGKDALIKNKGVQSHYDEEGRLSQWTVKKEIFREEDAINLESSLKTYKRDDVNAILSGDVSGIAYLDAQVPNHFNKDGKAKWVEEAKDKADKKITTKKDEQKKQTAMALKVQKESQLVQGLKGDDKLIKNGQFAWVENSEQKMTVKAEQKSKENKAKKVTIQRTNRANDGRL